MNDRGLEWVMDQTKALDAATPVRGSPSGLPPNTESRMTCSASSRMDLAERVSCFCAQARDPCIQRRCLDLIGTTESRHFQGIAAEMGPLECGMGRMGPGVRNPGDPELAASLLDAVGQSQIGTSGQGRWLRLETGNFNGDKDRQA